MKKIYKVILFSIVYFLLIYLISFIIDSDIIYNTIYNPQEKYSDEGTNLRIGLSSNIQVSYISGDKWYGHIEQPDSNSSKKFLYLFNLIKIPLYNKINFMFLHFTYLIILIFMVIEKSKNN